jgi:hypothetical protein
MDVPEVWHHKRRFGNSSYEDDSLHKLALSQLTVRDSTGNILQAIRVAEIEIFNMLLENCPEAFQTSIGYRYRKNHVSNA